MGNHKGITISLPTYDRLLRLAGIQYPDSIDKMINRVFDRYEILLDSELDDMK